MPLHRRTKLQLWDAWVRGLLACVFTARHGFGICLWCNSNSIKDRPCHMDSYLNRLLGSVVTTAAWRGSTRWAALHAFLHKYRDAHLDDARAMHLSLSLVPLPFLILRELEGRLKCLAWSAARKQWNYAEVALTGKAASITSPSTRLPQWMHQACCLTNLSSPGRWCQKVISAG